jgi:hypothetical protein
MGGRLVAFYADDLTELLVEDFLHETVVELQRIEKIAEKQYESSEVQNLAENIMGALADYSAQEHLVDTRWSNRVVQREI